MSSSAVEPDGAAAPTGSEIARWAASGAMWLTGRPDGPPAAAPGRVAGAVHDALEVIARHHPSAHLPDVRLLGERAAIVGLSRNAPFSCGGTFRVVPTLDGHIGVSLARTDDVALVPALVGEQLRESPWTALERWASGTPSVVAAHRTLELGLPASVLPSPTGGAVGGSREPARPGIVLGHAEKGKRDRRPLIIDFSSLWAGPLCAHLLGLCGAEVIKVESTRRLDGARRGPSAFYDLLHAGHRSVTCDFDAPEDRDRLRRLVDRADVVIEASRPRALRRVGLDAEAAVGSGTTWVSITARGRASDAVGFGDDIAVGAGLHTPQLWPVGDAIADPLTGVVAAAAVVGVLGEETAALVDVSMHDVCREIAGGDPEPHELVDRDGRWWVECESGTFEVADPYARTPSESAPAAGRHNGELPPV